MSDEQKHALRVALAFCRDRVTVPTKGGIDYEDLQRQIAALPDVRELRGLVAWVLDYERESTAQAQGRGSAAI